MDFPHRYHEFILQIGAYTGMPDPILHIHAGMAVLLLARLLTRRSLGSFIPLYFVIAAELANEAMDYLSYSPTTADTLSDIANTVFWPLVLSIAIRWRPMLPRDNRRRR
ncbi:MAG: hypothetical protein CMN72_09250 [Sphingomonas sp.]|nr:hypothetical protein [Sphingomonas sp.]|tara:strand:- start:264 stop:590 length:327 start_codon:yes stop_codon:yes gene_type:complete